MSGTTEAFTRIISDALLQGRRSMSKHAVEAVDTGREERSGIVALRHPGHAATELEKRRKSMS